MISDCCISSVVSSCYCPAVVLKRACIVCQLGLKVLIVTFRLYSFYEHFGGYV